VNGTGTAELRAVRACNSRLLRCCAPPLALRARLPAVRAAQRAHGVGAAPPDAELPPRHAFPRTRF
jgi:hypothetical protein